VDMQRPTRCIVVTFLRRILVLATFGSAVAKLWGSNGSRASLGRDWVFVGVRRRLGPSDVAAVGDDATVLDALKVMAQRDTAAVAVVAPAGLVGIFSEREHARSCLLGNRTANNTPVVDIMTRSVAGVAPSDSVQHCLVLMNERQVTHVAVLDQGRLVGLLSQTDLLVARVAYHESIFHETEMDQKLMFLRGTYSC
jgi:CBS domain-containing protein